MSWEPPFSTGTDGAEPTGLRRLLRQPGRNNLLLAGGAVVAAGILFVPGQTTQGVSSPNAEARMSEVSASPSPTSPQSGSMLGTPAPAMSVTPPLTAGDTSGEPASRDGVVYTIYLYKLPGLAPDAAPGTTLDIWVTWDRSVTGKPRVDLLVENATLQRIETGFEEGPVADLLLREKDFVNLIYGERFGQFNVSVDPA
jgi:hypothetical protein